jgi:hypothetical protein
MRSIGNRFRPQFDSNPEAAKRGYVNSVIGLRRLGTVRRVCADRRSITHARFDAKLLLER